MLRVLHEKVAARAASIAGAHGSWPCRKGCDSCCRRLAAVPDLTAAEWTLLRPAVEALPRGIRERIAGLEGASRPVVCPFLEGGACLVYEVRPVACRTYGFYVDRDGGQYCELVDALNADVVWGSGASVEADLASLGERRDLVSWWKSSTCT
jgi:Fe-S-cluster containining protein